MTSSIKKSVSAAILTGLSLAAWSPASQACSYDPTMASICVMAFTPTASRFQSFNNSQYLLAQGQMLSISQYTALYSLIGVSYGGNGSSTFQLPDLRGKVIVGYDPRPAVTNGPPAHPVGQTGGASTIKLTVAQLPPHAMTVTNLPVALNGVTATTVLSTLTGTASLSGMVLSGAVSGLELKASSGTGQNLPGGNFLGKGNGAAGNIYSNAATPDLTLNSGSIAGNLSLTVGPNVTAPVAMSSGGATTTIGGSASVSGVTSYVGANADVPVMPPYVVMPYYIAVQGLYPSSD